MARIVSVNNNWDTDFSPVEMSSIRWLKISEALSRMGHQVDIAVSHKASKPRWWRKASSVSMGPNLRRIPLSSVRWSDYDVVKTSHHVGFETLERFGGQRHPFIISSLASVVASEQMAGIYFNGKVREHLFATQKKVNRTSKYISLRGESAADLWKACFGRTENVLIVPGGAESRVPPPWTDPFPKDGRPRCVFAGNIYAMHTQPEAHRVLVDKLNRLGKHLSEHGVRLYVFGAGDARLLDKKHLSYLGAIPYEKTWDYLYFADVGCVLAYGSRLHNNESTKIYSYLRIGLPVVSEAGFPNDHIVGEARLGFTVENGNMEVMADRILQASQTDWDRNYAIQYILRNHTWDKRVQAYDDLIRRELGGSRAYA